MSAVGSSRGLFSSILIVGHPRPEKVSVGADFFNDFDSARESIKNRKHSVYVLHLEKVKTLEANQVFRELRKTNHPFELIFCDHPSPEFIEGLRIFRVLSDINTSYDESIKKALERVQTFRQNQQLLELIHEQNKKLLLLGRNLEERIEKRQSFLQKTHTAITETNRKTESFQRALMAVQAANSVTEMENLLRSAISENITLDFVKITLGQTRITPGLQKERTPFHIHEIELKLRQDKLGMLSFGRKENHFSKSERDFLSALSESISLALARMKVLGDTEDIKHQWEATFNSITSPLALVKSNYEVQRTNGAFRKNSGTKCFELLMKRKQPCENCKLGERFRIDLTDAGKVSILDVSSQKISGDVYVNIYRDISAQLQIESHMMESAKVAELGTIGSSIAHELNNPLSGIITFIQLVKMELNGSENYYSDILALEAAAQKCKETIQNLLGFSRTLNSP